MTFPDEKQNRRDFLGNVVKAGAGALAVSAFISNPVLAAYTSDDDTIATVKLADYKQLAKTGGNILLKDTAAGDLLVVRLEGDKYAVMSNICPHKKCEVVVKNPELIQCPCHKSAYAIDGTYQSGPAKKDLTRIPFTVKNGILSITKK